MRMLIQILWVTVLCSLIHQVQAQYFQFSQYNFTKQRINPALVSNSNYASVSVNFRHQPTAAGFNLNSNFLDVSYPIIARNGKRWSGFGLSFMDDRTGQQALFQTQESALSYAINATLSKWQTLSLGAKILYQSKQLNLDGLFTGAQFIPDRGFDESVFNGEDNTILKTNYVSLNLGLYWQQVDRRGNIQSYFGISFFDFNKPNNSFLEETNTLSSTAVSTVGFRAYKKGQLCVIPELLVTLNSNTLLFNVGAITRYELTTKSKGFNDHVNFITKFVPGRSVIAGVQFQRETFALGLSYDFPAGQGSIANTGAVEIGVELRRLVLSKGKRKSASKKPDVKTATKTIAPKQIKAQVVKKDSITKQVIANPALVESGQSQVETMSARLKHKQDSLAASAQTGSIKHEPYVIEKTTLHFNFEFNSADLDDESSQYLKDLSKALLDNPQLKIKVTGHTDNVGSDKFNLKLSTYRAEVIKSFIVEQGIAADRILADGKGMREPLNANKNEEERALNRRVELTIMYEE
ncbi:MAG: type IX secretion system membrane protein PorP/SprF [Cytophagia bacterium]|nr:type IX secretion system membrane protein PorP/SprF [Cytophagia bacterium]NBW37604.1 type IX secretion system membrane protein PorP/SprF [Cytophagia bacterium]